MKDFPDRVTIAQVPTGQSLELFGAVCEFFGSAIDGAVIVEGDGQDIAARLLGPKDMDHRQVANCLRSRCAPLSLPTETEPEPAEQEDDSLTIGHVTGAEDGGLDFGIGGSQLAEQWATHLLSIFMPAFEETGAANYIEYEGTDRETGKRLLLTVVHPEGKRPHVLRTEAEAEVARLRAGFAAVAALHPADGDDNCPVCVIENGDPQAWPCGTVLAIREALEAS